VELGDITVARKCASDAAAVAVFIELNKKYAAFCRLASTDAIKINHDGFKYALKVVHPELYDCIIAYTLPGDLS
jgi:hypothetical protein